MLLFRADAFQSREEALTAHTVPTEARVTQAPEAKVFHQGDVLRRAAAAEDFPGIAVKEAAAEDSPETAVKEAAAGFPETAAIAEDFPGIAAKAAALISLAAVRAAAVIPERKNANFTKTKYLNTNFVIFANRKRKRLSVAQTVLGPSGLRKPAAGNVSHFLPLMHGNSCMVT